MEGLRQVGSAAYSLADEADSLRLELGWDPWHQERGGQLFLVCAWNAFALQATADHLLEADARADPLTAGLLPEAILAFAQACYTQVLSWVQCARLAQADASYRLTVPLPATLPAWQQVEDTRPVHVQALRDAYEAVAPRAEYELTRLLESAAPEHASPVAALSLLAAQMRTAVEFAGGLASHARSHEQLKEVCDGLGQALGCAYTLGQVVAMPSLAGRLQLASYRANPSSPLPLTAIEVGWPVVDNAGIRIGTVVRLEGEPALGIVTALVISVGEFSSNRRVRVDQLLAVERGVVRLVTGQAALEPA